MIPKGNVLASAVACHILEAQPFMAQKVAIEFDEPFEQYFLKVAQFAFQAALLGWTWENTREDILRRIPLAVDYKKLALNEEDTQAK